MSTKTRTGATLGVVDTESAALPWVRKPGRVPIMSWAVPLEGSALEQATNLSIVPYAIGVDIGCGVALVETDLTVETLAPDELDRVLEAIDAGVPTGFQKLAAPVDRDVAATAMGMERPASFKEQWLTNALWQLGSLGGGNHATSQPHSAVVERVAELDTGHVETSRAWHGASRWSVGPGRAAIRR
jgi:hypothetical protein